jgi:hypothetical protein
MYYSNNDIGASYEAPISRDITFFSKELTPKDVMTAGIRIIVQRKELFFGVTLVYLP